MCVIFICIGGKMLKKLKEFLKELSVIVPEDTKGQMAFYGTILVFAICCVGMWMDKI